MHVLITGAGSFLGKLIIPKISNSGVNITAIWRNQYPVFAQIKPYSISLDLVQGDLIDLNTFEKLPNRVDAIIHIAAVSSNVDSAFDFVQSNIIGMKNLLDYATKANINCFIYLSSLSIHGLIKDSIVTENTPIINPSMYGLSKYVAEVLLSEKCETIHSIALRLPGVLGIGAHRHWLSTILSKSINDEDIQIFNPEATFNNAVHVDDLADFIVDLLNRNWTGYHAMPLGAEGKLNIIEVVNQIISRAQSGSQIKIIKEAQPSFSISSEYARNNFNYNPMNILEMINRYVDENIN